MSILGVIGAIGTLVAAGVNYFSAKETNETNEEINERNNEFNKAEREASQVYNSASSMIERGKMAGLNRMAAIGLPSSSPASAAAPIGMEAPKFDIGDIGNKVASAEQAESSAESQAADARLKDEQTKGAAISNSYAHEREYSNLLKTYESIDNMKMDTQEKEAQKKYLLAQMEHLRSMSPLLAEGQRNVNRLSAAQTDESIQNVAESKARVANESIRVALEKQKVRSELKVNDAQVKQLLAASEKLSWESADIQFRADFDQRKQAFFENYQTAETYLHGMSANAQVWLLKNQAALAGIELEKLARENDSDFNKFLQQNIGIDSKEFLNLAPNVVVPIGKFK